MKELKIKYNYNFAIFGLIICIIGLTFVVCPFFYFDLNIIEKISLIIAQVLIFLTIVLLIICFFEKYAKQISNNTINTGLGMIKLKLFFSEIESIHLKVEGGYFECLLIKLKNEKEYLRKLNLWKQFLCKINKNLYKNSIVIPGYMLRYNSYILEEELNEELKNFTI